MASMEAPSIVLPGHRELSPALLLSLEEHFRTFQDLSGAPDLASELIKSCSDLEADLTLLRRKLISLSVSWISRSFAAKSTLREMTLSLQNLSLYSSRCMINKKIRKMLGEDLPRLGKEVQRIDTIRHYAETTLQLEALVGDLEDAAISVINQHAGNMLSASSSNPSIDFGPKHEKVLQALKIVNDIEDVLVRVANFQSQWCHLIKSVDARVEKSLAVLRPQVLVDHRLLLASLGWPPKLVTSKEISVTQGLPNPLLLMQGEKRKCYSLSFQTLCALQHVQLRREERQSDLLGQKEEQKIGLWAIDELVSPIASRTEHHFSKWADQPEFIFALAYKITQDFITGVDDVLQPLIDRARLNFSAKEAWVSAMVQVLSGFLEKNVFTVLADRYKEKSMKSDVIPSWLHLIDLIVDFDRKLHSLVSSETYLLPESGGEFSRGISVLSIFCGRRDWLKIWTKIELKNAWKKLKVELAGERAWLTDGQRVELHIDTETEEFLLSSREDYKAPLIAESALKIAWGMVARCQTLPSIAAQIQFIRSTAARFLWYFFKVLLLRGKKIEFHPVNSDDDDILVRICGLINAARYCESKLQEWSDDVNFLELRVAENDLDVCVKDSKHDSYFFSEEINSLAELETNWLIELISHLLHQFDILSLKYFQSMECFQQAKEESAAATDMAVSIDFVEALDALRSGLCAIKKNLNPKDFLDLWRSVADGLDHFVLSSVLASEIKFSDQGVGQFRADIQALFCIFRSFCARPEAFFPCIRDSLKLLEMSKEEANHLQVVLSNDENIIKCLRFSGISCICFDQVQRIWRKRKF
ncbi:RINT1-like protein MAG2L isoform X2 [Malania oleifera]|uniref:RINT1-like protein MAG2L isoform X2 n=1 Tax=Malania oleifera TaxID=397392 RepID=UPI0025AE06F5|nr:RINT1-like protein MAG2L isoform X2 [Malania oleifera]